MVDEGDQGYAYDTTVSGTPKTQALRALRTLRALRALRYRTGKELFYERYYLKEYPVTIPYGAGPVVVRNGKTVEFQMERDRTYARVQKTLPGNMVYGILFCERFR